MNNMKKGLTLIEILISISLMVILVGVYFMVANPAGQLASSRNTKRTLDLQTIMNYIQQNTADSQTGQFVCASGPLPTSSEFMASAGTNTYNIEPCLITYGASALPFDPSASSSHYNSVSNYNTGYKIVISSTSSVITLTAPYAELGKTITYSH